MAHPTRNAAPANILNPSRIFFVTTNTSMGKRVAAIRTQCRAADRCTPFVRCRTSGFKLHDFVIMPDHVHLLIEVCGDDDNRKGHAAGQGTLLSPSRLMNLVTPAKSGSGDLQKSKS
jgi:hypothetical protein